MPDDLDRRFLAAALRIGAGGLGSTWPNPAVGAIVVKDRKVVGHGRTGRGGRPHGEALALEMAGKAAQGATLYVSLEPCSHYGKTPPCTDAILAAGIARVVTTRQDPDPRVAGLGLRRLREAGVAVEEGVLAGEAARVQAGHISRVTRGRPHVLLKLAVSADDAIGRRGETQTPVTGTIARRHVQALRSRADAILVGSGTVEADDPQLTCRLPGLEDRSPVRVVLDSTGRLPQSRKVFDGVATTWLFTADTGVTSPLRGGRSLQGEADASFGRGAGDVRRFRIPAIDAGLDLHACLARLAEEGITRLLVEGGARIARSFLETDLVDEVMLFRSPTALGGELVPALAGLPLSCVERSARFRTIERRTFGADRMSRYKRAR